MNKRLKVGISLIILPILCGLLLLYYFNREKDISLKYPYYEYLNYVNNSEDFIAPIDKYMSEISTAYMNSDGSITLLIYATPIRYIRDGELIDIDTRICSTRNQNWTNKGYKYTVANNDIMSYYPQKLDYTNGVVIERNENISVIFDAYNRKAKYIKNCDVISKNRDVILYENITDTNIFVYPTSLGTNFEFEVLDSKMSCITFEIDLGKDSNMYLRKSPGNYLVIEKTNIKENGEKDKEIIGLIQTPIIKDNEGNFSTNSDLHFTKTERKGIYKIEILLNGLNSTKGSRVLVSVELRKEKQPDNSIYSQLPNLTDIYLKNTAVIGNSPEYGVGRLMVRFKGAEEFSLNPTKIKNVTFNIYNLWSCLPDTSYFTFSSILEDWCAITGNWSKNYDFGTIISECNIQKGIMTFDITEEYKKWCMEGSGVTQHNGLLLQAKDENKLLHSLILTNDNSLFNNFTCIHLLP